MSPELIAPCGMNCAICVAYFGYTMNGKKRKHACTGCRVRKSRCSFIMKKCDKLGKTPILYCFECNDFPCMPLTTLDNKYRATYGMSMVDNLRLIQKHGMSRFLQQEEKRWKCPQCGGTVCAHNKKCFACGKTTR
jgi:hypothetical protein